MQDRELYRHILGIEAPWYVESVELRLESGEVHVHLAHQDGIYWPCPEMRSWHASYEPSAGAAVTPPRGQRVPFLYKL